MLLYEMLIDTQFGIGQINNLRDKNKLDLI